MLTDMPTQQLDRAMYGYRRNRMKPRAQMLGSSQGSAVPSLYDRMHQLQPIRAPQMPATTAAAAPAAQPSLYDQLGGDPLGVNQHTKGNFAHQYVFGRPGSNYGGAAGSWMDPGGDREFVGHALDALDRSAGSQRRMAQTRAASGASGLDPAQRAAYMMDVNRDIDRDLGAQASGIELDALNRNDQLRRSMLAELYGLQYGMDRQWQQGEIERRIAEAQKPDPWMQLGGALIGGVGSYLGRPGK